MDVVCDQPERESASAPWTLMQPVKRLITRCGRCLCFTTICLVLLASHAWANAFRYVADNTPVATVLRTFAEAQSKACELSPAIQGTITGELNFERPEEFYAFLERNQGIISYENTALIAFCQRSELQTELFAVRGIGISTVHNVLREMGVYDPHYGLKWLNDGQLLKLTAPPVYVEIVADVLMTLESEEPSVTRGTRVFRLKHAWADDITLNMVEKEVVIPGVASLLRSLTEEGTVLPSAATNKKPAVQRLKGQGLLRRTGTQTREEPRTPQAPARPAPQFSSQLEESTLAQKPVGARIIADSRLNAVIVWDELSRMPYYEELVQELDVPAGLVEIRAAIIDVSVNKLTELGISWGLKRQKTGDGLSVIGGSNVTSEASFTNMTGGGLNVSTIFVHGIDTFMNRVSALEDRGDASVLSRPAVLTMDNIQALLEVTNTFYVQVPGTYEVDLFDVTYGTVLRVTPHIIHGDDGAKTVKLVVHIEDGGSRVAPKDSGINLPVVSRTTISTQAVVGEDQALIIGGHYYESSTNGEGGVPVLMDIPGFGALFKTQGDSNQKQERLFVISPRLVDLKEAPERANAINKEQQERLQESVKPAMLQPSAPRAGCARAR